MKDKLMLYFKPDEVRAIILGLGRIIDDINAIGNDPQIPFTPEARKINREIYTNAKSAAAKLEKLTGISCELPPYQEGDEDEFLTKES